jgi:hypothetical protein
MLSVGVFWFGRRCIMMNCEMNGALGPKKRIQNYRGASCYEVLSRLVWGDESVFSPKSLRG